MRLVLKLSHIMILTLQKYYLLTICSQILKDIWSIGHALKADKIFIILYSYQVILFS